MPDAYLTDRPLGLREDFDVTEAVLASLTIIEQFEIAARREGAPPRRGRPTGSELELKRFFALPLLFPGSRDYAFVPSVLVDARWHRFILDTQRYRAFCERVYGVYLDHVPGPSRHRTSVAIREGPMQATVKSYTEAFGEPSLKYWAEIGWCGPCLVFR